MKKNLILLLILVSSFQLLSAQDKELQWLDIKLSNYEYPYSVSTIQLSIQDQILEMAYMDIKPDNYNGNNIVLMHGKNFNGAYWKTTIDALQKEGYRVIVPDQIGFGKSSKPPHFQYTFQQLAQNTKTLLDSIGVTKTYLIWNYNSITFFL